MSFLKYEEQIHMWRSEKIHTKCGYTVGNDGRIRTEGKQNLITNDFPPTRFVLWNSVVKIFLFLLRFRGWGCFDVWWFIERLRLVTWLQPLEHILDITHLGRTLDISGIRHPRPSCINSPLPKQMARAGSDCYTDQVRVRASLSETLLFPVTLVQD